MGSVESPVHECWRGAHSHLVAGIEGGLQARHFVDDASEAPHVTLFGVAGALNLHHPTREQWLSASFPSSREKGRLCAQSRVASMTLLQVDEASTCYLLGRHVQRRSNFAASQSVGVDHRREPEISNCMCVQSGQGRCGAARVKN